MTEDVATIASMAAPQPPCAPKAHAFDQERLAATIAGLAADGRCANEIGPRLGIPAARVKRIARRYRIKLAGPGGRRHITYGVNGRALRLLDKLADAAQVTRATMTERLLEALLEDDERAALKLLGKQARPKRQYRMRKPRGPRGPNSKIA